MIPPLRWFEEGGESRRNTAIVFAMSFITALMLIQPASAGPMASVVQDPEGDLGFGVDVKTSEIPKLWADNAPISEARYLDILSTWLIQKGKVYAFGMEVAAPMPTEGTVLPDGVKLVEWAMWIDPSPFHVTLNPVPSLFLIALRYDGSSYSAFILDYGTMIMAPAKFTIDGFKLQLEFSSASIGSLVFEWWSPLVRAWWGLLGSSGCWFVDAVDYGSAPGQVYYDLPWPPP